MDSCAMMERRLVPILFWVFRRASGGLRRPRALLPTPTSTQPLAFHRSTGHLAPLQHNVPALIFAPEWFPPHRTATLADHRLFTKTYDIVNRDLFVSCIRLLLRNLSLLINQDETRRKHQQYRSRGRERRGQCGFYSSKMERHDLFYLVFNISLYLSRRYDIHNDSGNGDIPSQAY